MIDIAALIPHAGAMVLLQSVAHWDAAHIVCHTASHLDPANPLRRNDRLSATCGIEYGLQAAALHGALSAPLCAKNRAQGYVASLRDVRLVADRLDDTGTLRVEARLEAREAFGMIYEFTIYADTAAMLLSGRAGIALPSTVQR